ncbi:zinc ABC transporter substrate-binding protein [Aquisalimonas sp.]|uniref:metal ABC transporter solute-binding protein, Zn/Mn family n=1 Tax=unclassified Aquisalimonas TaxID=2644645 RepID=UPI0025C17429|nr:zinc ABC transporter substrate-binding protein [Aquisalimonas sp.]
MCPLILRRAVAALVLCFPVAVLSAVPVTVSVPPQAYLVEAIGGDRVEVSIMIEPGQSPHTFSLSPRRMMALDDARVYFKVGHPDLAFERRFVQHVQDARRDVRVVDLADGVELMAMDDHADHHDHSHGETDPHLWVSPRIMRSAAERVADALTEVDPDGAEHYRAGLQQFQSDVDALDDELQTLFGQLERRRFVVNHPAWGYLARDYGLEQVAIESGGRDPSPAELARFIDAAKDEGIDVIFVQRGFSERSANTIAREIDAVVKVADPLAQDWLKNLREIGAAIREAVDS